MIRPYLRMRYRPLIIGSDRIPLHGSVLIVSNHLSMLDTVLIPSFAPRQVHFLAKASLFTTRAQNWLMRGIGAVPIQREAGSLAQTALNTGKQALVDGHVFAIFPEGSRSRSGKLHRGRSGAAWLALETHATVVPIGLIGTDLKKQHDGTRTPIEMRVGDPLDYSDLKDAPRGAARRELTERIMSAIQELSQQERSADYASGSSDS